jgi:hypothetical protein
LTPNERFDQDVKRDVEARVREGVKAVLEGGPSGRDDRVPGSRLPGAHSYPRHGERYGHYTRNLVSPAWPHRNRDGGKVATFPI